MSSRAQPRDRIVGEATGTTKVDAKPIESAPESEASAVSSAENPDKTARDKIVREATETRGVIAKELDETTGVRSGNDKLNVQLYGHINKAVLYANDGNEDNWYIVDNSNSSTRLGIRGMARTTKDLEVGTRFEVQFQTNPSASVSQIDKNGVGTNSFTKRWFDVFLTSKRFGEVRLGHGSTASDGSSEVDLSGTAVIGYSSVEDLAGGQFFYDNAAGGLSSTQVNGVFDNMDGLGREDRIYYKTPEFYGFRAATSWISGGAADVSISYAAKLGQFAVGAVAAYAGYGSLSTAIDSQINGSGSVLHLPSGLNFTLAAGTRDFKSTARNDASFWYGKLGYRREYFQIGGTALAFDMGRNNDVVANNDQADSFGVFGVQEFDKYGTEYYLGYRDYRLDRPGTDFNSVQAVMSGVRVKF